MREEATMDRRVFIQVAPAAPLVAAIPGLVPARPEALAKGPAGVQTPAARCRNRFPNILLTSHDGKSVRFYDDLLRDKTVVIHFM